MRGTCGDAPNLADELAHAYGCALAAVAVAAESACARASSCSETGESGRDAIVNRYGKPKFKASQQKRSLEAIFCEGQALR